MKLPLKALKMQSSTFSYKQRSKIFREIKYRNTKVDRDRILQEKPRRRNSFSRVRKRGFYCAQNEQTADLEVDEDVALR